MITLSETEIKAIRKIMLKDVKEHEDYILGAVTQAQLYNTRKLGFGDMNMAREEMLDCGSYDMPDELYARFEEATWNLTGNEEWLKDIIERQAACNFWEFSTYEDYREACKEYRKQEHIDKEAVRLLDSVRSDVLKGIVPLHEYGAVEYINAGLISREFVDFFLAHPEGEAGTYLWWTRRADSLINFYTKRIWK